MNEMNICFEIEKKTTAVGLVVAAQAAAVVVLHSSSSNEKTYRHYLCKMLCPFCFCKREESRC